MRLVDALTKLPEGYPIFTNRGASGIDGLLATAAGIGIGSNQPVVAMIGDTSTLYDLNSLALFKNVTQPTIIFVINNNGGAIFDMLPVDEEVKEQFYRLPHNGDFSQVAAMFWLEIRLTLHLGGFKCGVETGLHTSPCYAHRDKKRNP